MCYTVCSAVTAVRASRRVYLQNSDVAPIDDSVIDVDPDIAAGPIELTVGVTPHAVDPESAQRLWELSERLLGGR
jgi:hypothetical protein